ncbi:hypothetical protein AcV5_002021 [Taiwanofungus camphoratus]|nr:hypothetical protein AcV5_002021 [Antrodia cinnamomea]
MSGLETLPTELILQILQYLPFQSIYSLRLVSSYWRKFVTANDSSIYHQAALLHNYVASIDTLLSDAKAAIVGLPMDNVDDWRAYCQRRFQMDRNWVGQGSTSTRIYCSGFHDVHRIKVDEAAGLVITTHQQGGLRVTDMKTDELLWELSPLYVRPYAHCEYENGFLIFDRWAQFKEVWCLASNYDASRMPSISRPDDAQVEAHAQAERLFSGTTERGHFKPWSLLEMPEQSKAFRFVYPTLAVVGYDTTYLWDVTTGANAPTAPNVVSVLALARSRMTRVLARRSWDGGMRNTNAPSARSNTRNSFCPQRNTWRVLMST